MNDMSKYPRLVLRGTTYYFRAKVPNDIKATYGKSRKHTFDRQQVSEDEGGRRFRRTD